MRIGIVTNLDVRDRAPRQHSDQRRHHNRAKDPHDNTYRLGCTGFTNRTRALFASFYPAAEIAAIQQPLATLRKELLIVVAAIVGIRPFERLPLPLAIDKRDFRKDPVSQVDAVRMILRRGEHQLGGREIPRIKIQRPRFRMPPERGIFSFAIVGLALDASECRPSR